MPEPIDTTGEQLTLGSLFDGIGGFLLAAVHQGIHTAVFVEPEPHESCPSMADRSFVAGLDCRSGAENGDLCGTLQAHPSGGYSLHTLHPVRVGTLVRRLTPLECERLMGFPDGWTALPGASDSARYQALGNSVAIPCVEFVMKGIACVLHQARRKE